MNEMTARSDYALITGASAGLGAEFARQLAAAGHNLILVARREDRLSALADELRAAHKNDCQIIVADLSEPEAAAQIRNTCVSSGWQVSWLVNNAGVGDSAPKQDGHFSFFGRGALLAVACVGVLILFPNLSKRCLITCCSM